jgi:DNA mismatch repair protein MutS2
MNCRPLARSTVHTREKSVSTIRYSKNSCILSRRGVYRLSIVAAAAARGLGPAAEATLEVLEWKGLCHQVAAFASTSLGKRSLSQLVPASTEVEVRAEIASTRAVDALESEYAVELEFGGVRTMDAEGALRRAARGGLLTADALLSISSLLLGANKLQNAIGSVVAAASGSYSPTVQKVLPAWQAMEGLNFFPDIVRDIGFNIAPEGEFWSPLAPCVKESASDQVKRAAQKLRTVDSRLRNALKSSIGKQFVGSGAEISEYANRLCLSVHTPPENSHDGKFAGVVLARSGSSWFIEPESVVALNNEYQTARAELGAAEEVVLWELTGKIMDVVDALNDVLSAVVWMDVRVGKARYGRWIRGMLPNLHDAQHSESAATEKLAGSLCHPLLLASYLLLQQQNSPPPPPPTPVDIRVPVGTSAVVITGPNTGGKTAVLKTLGLAVLACNAGIPIAGAHDARSPLDMVFFDKVLADIGDEQSLSSNLSTFSGHLTRIAAIREEATPQSLVLLDELGTGTDPVEGAALGIAVLKSFQKLPCKLVVATTHHSSLSSLKYSSDSSEFENASVEFDQINLVPTYRLLWGIPGRSHAFSIARRLGLDPEVVAAAEEKVGGSAAEVEELIVELESVKRRIAEDSAAARREEDEGLAAMERAARVR